MSTNVILMLIRKLIILTKNLEDNQIGINTYGPLGDYDSAVMNRKQFYSGTYLC